jgi:hypothetical protein
MPERRPETSQDARRLPRRPRAGTPHRGRRVCQSLALFAFLATGTRTLDLRGHALAVHLYGPAGGYRVVVSSGDGGWIHLAPHVAETLATAGYSVIGVDTKAYLESFTSKNAVLSPDDVPRDYLAILRATANGAAWNKKPILVGVSEGAGLSVLAASDPRLKSEVAGIVGLGTPDVTELGWRWEDALTYVTHRSPSEPTFSTAGVVPKIAPLPLAEIHSSHDEFVSLAEVERVLKGAAGPTRLWVVDASNHRFSSALPEFDRRLLEAMAWVRGQQRGPRSG